MRRVLQETSGSIYEDIERTLTLRHRGCCGVNLKKATVEALRQIKLQMESAEKFIRQQKAGGNNC